MPSQVRATQLANLEKLKVPLTNEGREYAAQAQFLKQQCLEPDTVNHVHHLVSSTDWS